MNEAYFEGALRRAVELRRTLFRLDETTEAYRLINSDGDGLSGLTVDRYGDTLLCEVYSLGIAQRLAAAQRLRDGEPHGVRVGLRERERVDEDFETQPDATLLEELLPKMKHAPVVNQCEHSIGAVRTFSLQWA